MLTVKPSQVPDTMPFCPAGPQAEIAQIVEGVDAFNYAP
jgi:hypothetical protein